MYTILGKARNQASFEEKIQTKTLATQKNFAVVIKNFDIFCTKKYHRTGDQIISEYLKAEKG